MYRPNNKGAYPIISFDFETSGLPETGGRPIQLGAVLIDPYTLYPVKENAIFSVFMKLEPGEEMAPEAEAIHGYSTEYLQQYGVTRADAVQLFYDWLEGHGFMVPSAEAPVLDRIYFSQFLGLGQNLHFDLHFLDMILGRANRNIFHFKFLDTLPMAELVNTAMAIGVGFNAMPFRHPETGHPAVSLVAQAHAFGLEISGAHDAAVDARLAAEVYRLQVETLAAGFKQNFESENTPEQKIADAKAAAATGLPVRG